MKIYVTCFPTGGGSGNVRGSTLGADVLGCAMCEDGHVLAEHLSSSVGYAKHDMGLTSTWQHERYQQHCADGFELEWIDDPHTDPRWRAALAKNKLLEAERHEADATASSDRAVGQTPEIPI